jgi:hypothetical protein
MKKKIPAFLLAVALLFVCSSSGYADSTQSVFHGYNAIAQTWIWNPVPFDPEAYVYGTAQTVWAGPTGTDYLRKAEATLHFNWRGVERIGYTVTRQSGNQSVTAESWSPQKGGTALHVLSKHWVYYPGDTWYRTLD